MKVQINEQLALLEKELSRLKKVTDYIDDTKKTAQVVVSELKEVQDNYSTYTEKIFDLYKTSVEQLKKETELQIKEGVINFETTGNKIDTTNKEKLVETKRLLEQYRKIVEATDNLVKTLEAVDFPARLLVHNKNIQAVNSALIEAKQSIESKQNKIKTIFLQRLDRQDKEIKLLKTVLFVICGLIIIGTVATIFVLK